MRAAESCMYPCVAMVFQKWRSSIRVRAVRRQNWQEHPCPPVCVGCVHVCVRVVRVVHAALDGCRSPVSEMRVMKMVLV